jgi:DNA mismatch repair protein MutS2
MDDKALTILEYPKILERLAAYCAFAASVEKARLLRPTNDPVLARQLQAETREALALLMIHPELSIGGARDVRSQVDLALHGAMLAPNELLDVKSTLVAARTLARTFERLAFQFPVLTGIVTQLPPPFGLIDAISRALSERGEILDSASDKLEHIRRDLRVVHDRLMSRLQRMVSDPKNTPILQEALITQRDGRYVLPLRAEFKGRIRSIVHDQSSSGATLFVEPLAIVEMNNQFRELQLAERDEERRILTELSHQVGQYAFEINQAVEVMASLDLILSRAKFADDLHASEPALVPLETKPAAGSGQPPASSQQILAIRQPAGMGGAQKNEADEHAKIQNPKSKIINPTIRLIEARHPLLDQLTVVPIDFELDPDTFVLVITGPNTGGKTVALKTVGLLALMAQSGLHIPAHSGSELSVFDAIYADIGDEQSIEQSLSTFSGHITNIIHILENADNRSLVILDELGAGTDPQEGAALARSILTHLVERHITTLVTTHHPELKAFAHGTPGVTNASVEFDLETLRPTFHLTIGLPGRSNALAIAQRLGLPEPIILAARAEISPDDLRADDLLNEIHHQRNQSRLARQQAEQARQEAEALRLELITRLEKIEEERQKVLDDARTEATSQLETLQDELASVRRTLARHRQPVEALKEVEEIVEQLEEQIELPVERQEPAYGPEQHKVEQERRRAIRVGDKVRLRNLGAQGVVTTLGAEEAEVQVGVLRVRTKLADLELPSPSGAVASSSERTSPKDEGQQFKTKHTKSEAALPESPGIELDLRGQRADDAEIALERYLDAAFLAGLPWVRIIHGKGTGKLREVVRQALRSHPYIKSSEPGGEKEGGDGVTVAKLAVN